MRALRYQVVLVDPETGKRWRHKHNTKEAAQEEMRQAEEFYGMLTELIPVMAVKESVELVKKKEDA